MYATAKNVENNITIVRCGEVTVENCETDVSWALVPAIAGAVDA